MSFDPEIIMESFGEVALRKEEFADTFYTELFRRHPELRPLFAKTDLEKQKRKLVATLGMVVRSLKKPAALNARLQELGAAHIGYGAQAKHYAPVGEVLLFSLRQTAKRWTPVTERAWRAAYKAVAAQMLAGAGARKAA